MIQKKICMLGSLAVGKTSLVRRFVENMFSDKYLTTIGVKIQKKILNLQQGNICLVIWDIAGEDGFSQLRPSYLRGMSGYLLVVDKTRESTLSVAKNIRQKVEEEYQDIPHIMLMNKTDLTGQWDIKDSTITELHREDYDIVSTSAKTGLGVEEAFTNLAAKMLEK